MRKILLLLALLISVVTYADNKIYYTSSDGGVVKPYYKEVFGAKIVSNTYTNGQGVITFDGELTSIGSYAFYECSRLTSVTIPNSVTSIEEGAFDGCSGLTSVTIPNSVTSIGSGVFTYCSSLVEIYVDSDNPKYMSENGNILYTKNQDVLVFALPSLKGSVTIPNSVTGIGSQAFYGCSGLTSVTIPNSVTSIEGGAFYNCSGLKAIYAKPTTPPTLSDYGFYGVDKNTCILYVPETPSTTTASYAGATGWNEFSNIKTFDASDEDSEYEIGKKYADCNGDGNVNGADIVAIYNFIVNGTNPRGGK